MRYASSIKYGGLLIDANTADYSSFLKLGLVCPYCAENVYLVDSKSVAATKRKLRSGKTTQVKGYTCESYFAHYSDVDATECELRCAKTGKKETIDLMFDAPGAIVCSDNRDCEKILVGIINLFFYHYPLAFSNIPHLSA